MKLKRVVAEQRQMAGTAAGRDAGCDRGHPPLRDAVGDERVEIGCPGRFERRLFPLFLGGEVAEAVEHDEGKFRVYFESQFRIKSVQVHVPLTAVAAVCAGRFTLQKHRSGRIMSGSRAQRQRQSGARTIQQMLAAEINFWFEPALKCKKVNRWVMS